MSRCVVTVNAGGGFSDSRRKQGMTAWAENAVRLQPLVVFAQEVPSDEWLAVWTKQGYDVVLGPDKGWRVRSALIVDKRLRAEPHDHVTASYHGSYLATARVTTASGPLLLSSMHASPNPAEPAKYGWPIAEPKPRHGGGDPRFAPNVLWDSDLVLETLRGLASDDVPLLAAGDLNEARGHDLTEDERIGTWGEEYFARVTDAGLDTYLTARWGAERATREHLQLDHVLVTSTARPWLGQDEPYLDVAWDAPGATQGLSDHRAVWVPVEESAW